MRTDRELIAAIIARDETACQELYEVYGEELRQHLARTVRDAVAADDLLQELLLRVWNSAEQWRGDALLKSWLYRIATNLALNYIRAQGRKKQEVLDLSQGRIEEEGKAPGWLVDEASLGADAVVEQEERRRLLNGCIEALSEEKREVLRLVYDAEMEVRAAAIELNVPEGTVKSRLYHARRELARPWRYVERKNTWQQP
jgi:RNA polymerase sigma-70 factor, ECF subfamily